MKKITFTVTIGFSEKISSDEELKIVAENVARAIENEANGAGMAPESSEAYTTDVEVSSEVLGINVQRSMF